jgi:hypothetical protein
MSLIIILIILLILFFRPVSKNANIVDVMIEIWPPEAAGNCIYDLPGSRLLFSNLWCSLYLLRSTVFCCLLVLRFSSLQSRFCVLCSIFAPWRYSSLVEQSLLPVVLLCCVDQDQIGQCLWYVWILRLNK